MKYIKLIFIALCISFFTSISYGAQDCSNLKTFSHKWIKCKTGQGGGVDVPSSDTSTESSGEKKLSLWGQWRAWNEKNKTLSDMNK